MSYIGSQPADQTSGAKPRDEFVGTGSQTNFTLSQEVPGGFESNILVVVDNVLQQPIESYTIQNNNTLVFSEAPASGSFVYVLHQGNATYQMIPVTGSVTPDKLSDNLRNFTVDTFTGTGSQTAFTLTDTPASANAILVFVDGIMQTHTVNYTLAGDVVTFTSAPDLGSPITVVHLGFATVSRTGLVDGSITTTKLADGAVTTAKIGTGAAVSNIGTGGITANELSAGSVTAAKIASGQILPAAGITFPAAQVASSDANTLDDYEEGTWTPTATSDGGAFASISYAEQFGRYVKIGKQVTIQYYLALNSYSGGSGAFRMGSLPFNPTGDRQTVCYTATYNITFSGQTLGAGASGTTVAWLGVSNAGTWSTLTTGGVPTGAYSAITGVITYLTT